MEIRFVGLREGEKLKEELFYQHEEVTPTSCEKIKRTCGPLKEWPDLCRQLDELRASLTVDGAAPVRAKIKEIVPEYCSAPNEATEFDKQLASLRRFRAVAGHN